MVCILDFGSPVLVGGLMKKVMEMIQRKYKKNEMGDRK